MSRSLRARTRTAVLGLSFLALLLPTLALADGSQSYTTPGTYTFNVPSYTALTVTVNGAGGGGGGGSGWYSTAAGGTGGNSSFNGTVVGYGGGGGASAYCSGGCSNGSVGGASGGTDTAGGGAPGGGGGGSDDDPFNGGSGGNGGQASIIYSSGVFSPNSNITVVVGQGGPGGTSYGAPITEAGSPGANGSVNITWTSPAAPTCSITLTPNPSSYSYSGTPVTLSWTSSNASQVYINTIGWVGTSGSTQVASQSSTNYSCYGYSSSYGDGQWDTTNATLTVNPPSSPTTSIAASSTSIYTNQSTNLLATFTAGSGDQLIADNIDEPSGTGIGANTNPGPKSITFSTTTPGSYTFFAMAQTSYYTNWTSYASTTVTVSANPQCTLSLSPNTISQGATSTLFYSSSNASSFSISGGVGSESPDTSGHAQVSPSQTTTYTGTATAGSAQNSCSATLGLSCQESWSCDGDTIVQTNTDCSTTNLTTCESPQFCEAGSSECLYPAISENASGSQSGNLEDIPGTVHAGNSVQVYWNVSNAEGCTVTGTNGDSWTGLSSPQSGYTSSAIEAETVYTLSCQAYGTNPDLTETQTVDVAPAFREL